MPSPLYIYEGRAIKYITTAYAAITENGEVTVKEESYKFCLSNTKILILREGRVIFRAQMKNSSMLFEAATSKVVSLTHSGVMIIGYGQIQT
jgi:hypothetical protein